MKKNALLLGLILAFSFESSYATSDNENTDPLLQKATDFITSFTELGYKNIDRDTLLAAPEEYTAFGIKYVWKNTPNIVMHDPRCRIPDEMRRPIYCIKAGPYAVSGNSVADALKEVFGKTVTKMSSVEGYYFYGRNFHFSINTEEMQTPTITEAEKNSDGLVIIKGFLGTPTPENTIYAEAEECQKRSKTNLCLIRLEIPHKAK